MKRISGDGGSAVDEEKKRPGLSKKWTAVIVCTALAAAAVFFAVDYYRTGRQYSSTGYAMGAVVSQNLEGAAAQETAAKILQDITAAERKGLSRTVEGSDIYRVNAAGDARAEVGADTAAWLGETLAICEASSGALDITLGAVSDAWGIGTNGQRVPTAGEIAALLRQAGYAKVYVDGATVTRGEGQSLDMGALGKGIACDIARDIAAANGIDKAVVSVGGSVMLYSASGNETFTVGIRNPGGEASEYMGILTLKSGFVSTSGNYEKFFELGGKRYHHILDPATGYPADSGLTSVTVFCQSGLASDALSTACFVLGYEKSLPLLEKYSAQAVFIAADSKVCVTGGLKDLFKLTDTQGYTLVDRL